MASITRPATGRARIALVALQVVFGLVPAWASARSLPRQQTPSATLLKRSELQVECGNVLVDGPAQLRLRSGCVRLLVGQVPRASLSIAFWYRGPSADAAPLASGELRRQIGIKLRAKDTCNVVYVMWHLGPTRGLHVSVKSNPGQGYHAQCGDRGYLQVVASSQHELPPVDIGKRHTLSARIAGKMLRVHADGALAWEGRLPDIAFTFDGPAGLRSDNGDFDVEIDERADAARRRK